MRMVCVIVSSIAAISSVANKSIRDDNGIGFQTPALGRSVLAYAFGLSYDILPPVPLGETTNSGMVASIVSKGPNRAIAEGVVVFREVAFLTHFVMGKDIEIVAISVVWADTISIRTALFLILRSNIASVSIRFFVGGIIQFYQQHYVLKYGVSPVV